MLYSVELFNYKQNELELSMSCQSRFAYEVKDYYCLMDWILK